MKYNGSMKFSELISAGQTVAVIGGGGKTGLIEKLETALHEAGRPALVSVTTRLGREQLPHLARVEAGSPDEALAAAERAARGERLLLAGPFKPDNLTLNKFSGLPPAWFPLVRRALGPELSILVEADGSAGRPLKIHRAGEPAPPPGADRLIAVLGLSVLVRPWVGSVHRAADLPLLCPPGELPEENAPLRPAQVAAVLGAGWRGLRPDLIFLNQADLLKSESERSLGRDLMARLGSAGWPLLAGSLRDGCLGPEIR
ncbi:MAG: putative selenium-dependent hydroxylase accessory protein YqeC [Candidatus Adiutrix sp.]|nr:putative selenium-dependent hydroxylase accessory protein YqeC [Candidatus Adiutrix sp.]